MARQQGSMMVSLVGRTFTRLTVEALAAPPADRPLSPSYQQQTWWACRCSCGMKVVRPRHNLVSGHTTSCGCLAREILRQSREFRQAAGPTRKTPNGSEAFNEAMDVALRDLCGRQPALTWKAIAHRLGVAESTALFRASFLGIIKAKAIKAVPGPKVFRDQVLDDALRELVDRRPAPTWDAIAKRIGADRRTCINRANQLGLKKPRSE